MTTLGQVDLILASTSRYRRDLLARVAPRFRQLAPAVDETSQPDERAADLVVRLAQAKAQAVAAKEPGTLVIGSDQAAELDGLILGKPGTVAAALAQLLAASGRIVTFHTAICLVDTRPSRPIVAQATDRTHVHFRRLRRGEIERYIGREQPLDCAGSFKAEALGVALFERIESDDPTALIGLPLIALCRLLRESGIEII
ncbi:MAG TPA: Maf family nucleotide pyrophosphatase [Rudaea sp.]|jgi:septum formation protein